MPDDGVEDAKRWWIVIYTPLSKLTGALRMLLVVEAAVLIAGVVAPGEVLLTAAAGLFVLIAGAFVAWLRLATENLVALGLGSRFRPGWAAAVWFVPFANAVVPYLMIGELWRRSSRSSAERLPPVVVGWWTAFVAALVWLSAEPGFDTGESTGPRLLLGVAALLGQGALRRLGASLERAAGAVPGGGEAALASAVVQRLATTVVASLLVVWGAVLAAGVLVVVTVNASR